MASVILFVVGAMVSWVVLMIVLPLAQKLADFTLPGFVETAWKGAVIVLATNLYGPGADQWFSSLDRLGGDILDCHGQMVRRGLFRGRHDRSRILGGEGIPGWPGNRNLVHLAMT